MTAEPGEDLAALPAHRLAASIAAGELTSAALTADCLARIRATNAKLHAFVAVYEDEAMAIAEARDREARAGMTLGPLHGVPVARMRARQWAVSSAELDSPAAIMAARRWAGRATRFSPGSAVMGSLLCVMGHGLAGMG